MQQWHCTSLYTWPVCKLQKESKGIKGVLASKARRAEDWGQGPIVGWDSWGEGAASLSYQLEEHRKIPSRVRGRATAAQHNFPELWDLQAAYSATLARVNSNTTPSIWQQQGLCHHLDSQKLNEQWVINCSTEGSTPDCPHSPSPIPPH